MMGSSYKLWDRRLRESETLTKGQITQFCNAVAAGAYGFIIGGHRTNLTPHECALLMDTFAEKGKGYKLTREHTKFGLEWLKADEKRALSLGVTPNMIDTFIEFRLVDVRIVKIKDWITGSRAHIVPVYRFVSRAGIVDYYWSPWQQKAYA